MYTIDITQSNGKCSYVFLVERYSYPVRYNSKDYNPVVLQWFFEYSTGPSSAASGSTYYFESDHTGDYVCSCGRGQGGNPYLPDGCQDLKECAHCEGRCIMDANDPTNYICLISRKRKQLLLGLILGLSLGVGSIIFLLGCYLLYDVIRRRQEIKRKAKYFKQNGGLLLQQQISSIKGAVEKTNLFTSSELETATDSFNRSRILGQGGQGTVYKGMLMDGRIVAIKKSQKMGESQVEQFINEVVILSQINHRNVVKLLGCCLETEVPILVYEFIPNGTLSRHIHNPSEDFRITWKMRLQIAAESAGALAYLHSSSSTPVYHRDIKSSNILLDEKYRAKVSDFGISRSITMDQTHLTTSVRGTFGYLDPEYFRSNQFTEKSDVYSFGVVLVELLTGKKPIYPTKTRECRSLATEFLILMENDSLFDILDTLILQESNRDELMAVADLARRCLSLNARQRPTMKEVAMVLEGIRSSLAADFSKEHAFSGKSEAFNGPLSSRTHSLSNGTSYYNDNHTLFPNTVWF